MASDEQTFAIGARVSGVGDRGWGTVVHCDGAHLIIQFDKFPCETPTVAKPEDVIRGGTVVRVGAKVSPGSDFINPVLNKVGEVVSVRHPPDNHRQVILMVEWEKGLPEPAVIGFSHPAIGTARVDVVPAGTDVVFVREACQSSFHNQMETISKALERQPRLTPKEEGLVVKKYGDRFAVPPGSDLVMQMIETVMRSSCSCSVEEFTRVIGGLDHGYVMEVIGDAGRCGKRVRIVGTVCQDADAAFNVCGAALSILPLLADTDPCLMPLSRIRTPDGKLGGTVLWTTEFSSQSNLRSTTGITKIMWDVSPDVTSVPNSFLYRALRPTRPLKEGDRVSPSTECTLPTNRESVGVITAVNLQEGKARVRWETGDCAGAERVVKFGKRGVVEILPAAAAVPAAE